MLFVNNVFQYYFVSLYSAMLVELYFSEYSPYRCLKETFHAVEMLTYSLWAHPLCLSKAGWHEQNTSSPYCPFKV
jgi:hypothetical protein